MCNIVFIFFNSFPEINVKDMTFPYLFELHHQGQIRCSDCQLHTAHRPFSSWMQGGAVIPSEAAGVWGGGQGGEVRGEGCIWLPPRGSHGRDVPQRVCQLRAGAEDHPGSGAAGHPPGQDVRLGEVKPSWR